MYLKYPSCNCKGRCNLIRMSDFNCMIAHDLCFSFPFGVLANVCKWFHLFGHLRMGTISWWITVCFYSHLFSIFVFITEHFNLNFLHEYDGPVERTKNTPELNIWKISFVLYHTATPDKVTKSHWKLISLNLQVICNALL